MRRNPRAGARQSGGFRLEVSDETLAVDVLAKVGPGGDFLGQRHTRRHLRDSQWRAQLLNRMSYERWFDGGGLDVTERARLKARDLLRRHETPALPADVVAGIDAAIAAV